MNNMKKIIAILLMIASIVLCLTAVGCTFGNNQGDDSSLAASISGGSYDYTYDRPFYSTPDEFMTIDGEFDEEEWQDCVWMETTQYDVTYRITTLFTQKGIYVAAYATDPNIRYNGRNNFINNSSFEIQIVRANDALHDSTSRYNVHPMNDFIFQADAKTCRSYRERQFNGAVKCVGEPNSGNTTSLSYEMFLGWDQMGLTEADINPETGIPDSVRIYCQYIMIDPTSSGDTKYISPFLMDFGKFHSYYDFGAKGIINRPDNGVVGSAIGGTTSTDKWIMDNDEAGGPLSADIYQTHHIWFTHDKDGNEISRLTSFVVDAQVTADVSAFTSTQSTFGIMTIHDMWSMVTYGVNMYNLVGSNKVILESIEGIDSTAWVGQLSMAKTAQTGYTDNTICLRLIKNGGYYYYFYKNPADTQWTYIGYEFWYKNEGEVDVGLFTNCPTTITNYSVVDYSGREDELARVLGETVYFVETDASGGEIETSDRIIRQGESFTFSVVPDSGRVLTELKINGVDKFDEFVANNCSLTITPDCDIEIYAKFVKIPEENLRDIEITVVDENGNPVANADYTIESSNPLLVRTGTTNGRGKIVVKIPAAGSFELDGRTYTCDGSYTISLTKTSYIGTSVDFTLSDDFSQTVTMKNTLWGKNPTVNGTVAGNTAGTLYYDPTTDTYYAQGGTVRHFYTNTKTTTGEYIYSAVVKTQPVFAGTTIQPVPGIALASGGYATTINLKSAWWEGNRLCIEINGKEISISNFRHSLNNGTTSGSQFAITVVRYNDALYIYDVTDALCVILDEDGVHPQGGRTIVNKSGLSYIETQLAVFFANGKENICGPLVYDSTNARIDYTITATEEGVKDYIFGGTISVSDEMICESGKPLDEYLANEQVTLKIKATDPAKAVKSVLLTYEGGTKVLEGSYDIIEDVTTFTFDHNMGNVSVSVKEYANVTTVSGKVSGASDPTKVKICFGGTVETTYDGLVKADGTFSVKVPSGDIGMAFIEGGKLAIVAKQSASALGSVSVTLETNALLVGNATVNGKDITSKGTVDFDTYAGFASGDACYVKSDLGSELFGNSARKEYALLLTNSATSGDFEITSVTSSTGAYGRFGLAITDGENILAFQIGAQTENGKWYVDYGAWREGAKFNLNRNISRGTADVGLNSAAFSNITFKLVKSADGLTVYIGGNEIVKITNADIGEEFFVEGREYCAAIATQMISGNIYHDVEVK